MFGTFKEYVGRLTGHADEIREMEEANKELEDEWYTMDARARRASERANKAEDANADLSRALAFNKRRMEALDGLDMNGAAGYIQSLENALRKRDKHLPTPKGFVRTEYEDKTFEGRCIVRFGIQRQEFAMSVPPDYPAEEAIQLMRARFMDEMAPAVWREIEQQVFREKDKVA